MFVIPTVDAAWLRNLAEIIAELDAVPSPAPQRPRKRRSKLRPLWEE